MTIRPYTDHDLEELLDVWYRASLFAHWFLPKEFFDTERRQIIEHWLRSPRQWSTRLAGTSPASWR